MTSRYYGPNWQEQRQACLERDDHSCVSCDRFGEERTNRRSDKLHVHHKLPVAVFEENCEELPWDVVNNLDNLITLCATCHRLIEHGSGNAEVDFQITGKTRDKYLSRKPHGMTHNEFIGDLLDTADEYSGTEVSDKVDAYREIEHDIRAMIRGELEQFARKYFDQH